MSRDVLTSYLESRDYSLVKILNPGHTGCAVVKVNDNNNLPIVIKYTHCESGKEEIINNLAGYKSLLQCGAKELLPAYIKCNSQDKTMFLEMSYLGESISETLRNKSIFEWNEFWNILVRTVKNTVTHTTQNTQNSRLEEYFTQIENLTGIIGNSNKAAILTKRLRQMHRKHNATVDPNTSVMILDFTPDNTFFVDGKIKFIDPWKQTTFQGSFIPAIGQFKTLTKNIYNLPTSDSQEFEKLSLKAAFNIGEELGLDITMINSQVQIGAALQYCLSSLVRLDSNRNKSKEYYESALLTLEEACV